MLKTVSIQNCCAVFGSKEYTYQTVVDDFKNAKFIGIMTFNISPRKESYLLNKLKEACLNGTDAVVITNIPKRYSSYFKPKYAIAAKDMIDLYMRQLNPQDYGMRLNPYFAFHNHAKVVMTDNMIYWGSSNFSDESSENFECGTISTDKDLIDYMRNCFFPAIQNKSAPYYKHNIAVAIANLESLIPVCNAAKQNLHEAAFEPWADYETNFEEKWIYRTTQSGVTVKFLRGFIELFSQFDDALNVIDEIIEEHWEYDELPEQVELLKNIYENYKSTFESFYYIISSLFNDLEQMAEYNVSAEACKIINRDYGMEAYDEELDYYAQKAVDEASEEYEELIRNSE